MNIQGDEACKPRDSSCGEYKDVIAVDSSVTLNAAKLICARPLYEVSCLWYLSAGRRVSGETAGQWRVASSPSVTVCVTVVLTCWGARAYIKVAADSGVTEWAYRRGLQQLIVAEYCMWGQRRGICPVIRRKSTVHVLQTVGIQRINKFPTMNLEVSSWALRIALFTWSRKQAVTETSFL
jgi:hypothetical protein